MSKQEASNIVSVGDVLAGKYRVEKVLGMGGMGVVVAATHLDLREVRAVKLMRPEAESEQSVERFLREARAVVRLRSEHVAEVYDVGRLDSGAPYIVMEMLEGQDLAAIVKRRGPLPVEEAVLYVSQACHALAEAHAAGIVHRDLKPGNLFLTRRTDGSPCIKVLDFGISKHTRPLSGDPEMTGARDLMGSPLYMAPEQMRSARKVCARADVWALGAILYKLLTGRAPFQAPTVPEIFAAALAKPAKLPSSVRADVPPGLDAVLLRCLDKHPARRYASAAELLTALRPHGPWGASADEEGEATLLCSPARRSTIPPGRARVTPILMSGERRSRAPVDVEMQMDADETPTSSVPRMERQRSRPSFEALDEQTEMSVSPWEGTRPRATTRPAKLALIAGLTALSALAGAGLAAIVVQWSSLPPGPHRAEETRAHGSHRTNPPSAPALPSATPSATPNVAPATSASAIEINLDAAPATSADPPSPPPPSPPPTAAASGRRDVMPARASSASTTNHTRAKPSHQPPQRDPFTGRY